MQKGKTTLDYTYLDELVQRGQQGDKAALETLLLAFKPLLWSVIGRYVYDQGALEDAYQEACVVFMEGVRDFALEAGV